MSERSAASIRDRVRVEMTEEIKEVARRHLATDGANLSLRAVARDLGMVSSALYRYFASRDDLLTALILDAYNALGEAVERAEAEVARTDYLGRWFATCRTVRSWALASPHEYKLIYGSPVPGYQAPPDTIGPATRPTAVMGRILNDAYTAGAVRTRPGERLPRAVRADLGRARTALPDVPEPVLARGLTAWIQLFGFISFELFGRFDNTVDDLDAFFEHQIRVMADVIGITRGRS